MSFGLIELLFIWFSFSFVAGWIASYRGNSFKKTFTLSLLLTPVVGIIVALFSKSNIDRFDQDSGFTPTMKKSPDVKDKEESPKEDKLLK